MNQQTILIVDDNPSDREIFSRYLTHSKGDVYRVLEADSGKGAIKCLRHETPACILLDCGLLDMDGLALLALLKDENDLQRFPVVMLTGFDSAAKAVEAMRQGAQDYLTKDGTTTKSLVNAINHAIDQHTLHRVLEKRRRLVEAQRKELLASEHRLEEAQQVAHMGSWEFDLGTQKIVCSKELLRLLDIAPERNELDIAAYLALFAPEDAARLEACFRDAARECIGYEIDIQRVALEGDTTRWYHAVGKPISDGQGKVIRLVGTLLDITERKSLVREMQAANEQLADINAQLLIYGLRAHEQAAELEARSSELISTTI